MIQESVIVFHQTVKEMREAQKTYFKERTTENLQKAKKLEKSVDDQIQTVDALLKNQG